MTVAATMQAAATSKITEYSIGNGKTGRRRCQLIARIRVHSSHRLLKRRELQTVAECNIAVSERWPFSVANKNDRISSITVNR